MSGHHRSDDLEREVRVLSRKLERAKTNLARLEDQRERSRRYLQSVIETMQNNEDELVRRNRDLELTKRRLERSERELREASQSKSRFLANMSHELRTPLNAIIGYAELLRDDDPEPMAAGDLGKILTSARHLLGLINEVLDISKIESGQFALESIPMDVGHILYDVSDTVRPLVVSKSIDFDVRCSGVPALLQGDPVRLKQILTNIIENAVKFTEEGRVSVGAEYADDLLTMRIRDTGIGMTSDQISRVFRPFEQADTSMTRRYGGTGLGLSICRRLIDIWGGTMEVTSDLGVGTEFHVVLPCPQLAIDDRDPQ